MRKLKSPFVIYKLPQGNTIYLIIDKQPKAKKSIADIDTKAFVIAPFDSDSDIAIWTFDIAKRKEITLEKLSEISIDSSCFPHNEQLHISSKKQHEDTVNKMVSIIKTGKIGKGVLSRIKSIDRKNEDIISVFIKLLRSYPTAFVYLTCLPNNEIWCGASPEILANYQNKKLTSMALAGTQLLGNTKIDELVWPQKEKDEQKWVQNHISDIFNDLGLDFHKSKTYSRQAGHLAHLCTDFNCDTNSQTAVQILNMLHPTPAICGSPTKQAKETILNLESHNRKYYCGFIGLYSSESFQLFVNLRCMMISKNNYYLYVGGGITADSDAENEWYETESKAQTLTKIIE